MASMNKTKFLYIVLGLLVISNLILAYFVFEIRSHRKHPVKPRDIIIERLQFDTEQIEKYDDYILIQRRNVRKLKSEIRELKSDLYSQLNINQNDSTINNIMLEIGERQQELERSHYNHFLDIKSICTKEQLPLFEELSSDLVEIFQFDRRPPPPR
jgi:periplasmic protein CpxP/Spy